jgi:hypothetical protein
MDLALTITNNKIESTLYEKEQNLYLYIPPTSAHPKGMLSGLIHGNILRIHRLCSNTNDIHRKTLAFYKRLTRRGYHQSILNPIFNRATQNAINYTTHRKTNTNNANNQTTRDPSQTIFFHLPYHPQDPPARDIQQIWRETIAEPPGHPPITEMTNNEGAKIPTQKLTVAHSRHPNLRNLFSIRKISTRGQEVSKYINE